jgi:outer membrane protein assembly factor BamB
MGNRSNPLTTVAAAAALLLAGACAAAPSPDSDWPQFLGPNRNGKVAATIRRAFSGDGPPVLWRRPVGAGFASPSVVGDTVYLFHRSGDEEIVEALEAATGRTRWSTANPTDYRDVEFGFDEGPRAAPTVVGGVVFTAGVKRYVQALDAANGDRLWGFDAIERYDTRRSPFGNASQPFWVDGRIVLNIGGREAGIVAVDARNGETVWTATDHEASYAPPLLTEIHGQRRLLFFTRLGLVDLDPGTGKVRSSLEWHSRSWASVNAAMPVQVGDRVFLSASYGTGAVLLDVDANGFEPVWTSDEVLSNHYVTSIYDGGVLYGMHGRQPLNPSLRAVDPETGEVLWTERRFGTGSLLLAGNTLIVMREDGELTLVDATGDEYRELASASIFDSVVRAYPALAGGILYARDEHELLALDLRPEGY